MIMISTDKMKSVKMADFILFFSSRKTADFDSVLAVALVPFGL